MERLEPGARQADEAFPDQAGKPEAEKVSARPVATWLATKIRVSTPKSSAISAPAMIAASEAEQRRAGDEGGAEAGHRAHDHHALDAEIEDAGRSTTSSPIAAMSSGVAAVMMVRMSVLHAVLQPAPEAQPRQAASAMR